MENYDVMLNNLGTDVRESERLADEADAGTRREKLDKVYGLEELDEMEEDFWKRATSISETQSKIWRSLLQVMEDERLNSDKKEVNNAVIELFELYHRVGVASDTLRDARKYLLCRRNTVTAILLREKTASRISSWIGDEEE